MTETGTHKIGFVGIERWQGADHRVCEAPRHEGVGIPATAVVALAGPDGDLVWGACIECFGLMDLEIEESWEL